MKRLLAMAVAIVAVTMFSQSEVQAQNFHQGFQFGAGLSTGFGGGGCNSGFCRGNSFRDDLPYFAKFPPVYYSNIIARPVGISPFAAPAGVRPVELDYAPVKQVTKKNPFFKRAVPVKSIPATARPLRGKTTWVPNPYLGSFVAN